MLFFENVKLAISSIRINKVRSLLTMLGIIIGIAAVISIVSIGDTMRSVIADAYESIGMGAGYVYLLSDGDYYTDSELFTEEDVEKIEEVFGEDISYISGASNVRGILTDKRQKVNVYISPIKEGYEENVLNMVLIKGRMITKRDCDSQKHNIVIEESTANEIFKTTDVIGKTVRASFSGKNGDEISEFNIVGIYRENKSILEKLFNSASTKEAFIPESLMVSPQSQYFSLAFYTSPETDRGVFERNFISYVSRLKNKSEDKIVYESAESEFKLMDSVMGGLSAAVGAIAAISLVVGGIGIMNIMLVSVTERTKEIGIRKALGASTGDIMVQFLTESAIIAALGGLIGTIIGISAVMIIGRIVGLKTVVRLSTVITAVVFSGGVGIFFGIVPARKAAGFDPVRALRYE